MNLLRGNKSGFFLNLIYILLILFDFFFHIKPVCNGSDFKMSKRFYVDYNTSVFQIGLADICLDS